MGINVADRGREMNLGVSSWWSYAPHVESHVVPEHSNQDGFVENHRLVPGRMRSAAENITYPRFAAKAVMTQGDMIWYFLCPGWNASSDIHLFSSTARSRSWLDMWKGSLSRSPSHEPSSITWDNVPILISLHRLHQLQPARLPS